MTTAGTIMIDQASTAEPAGSPPTPAVGRRAGRPRCSVGAVAHRDGRGVRSNVGTAVEHLLRQRADLPTGHPDRPVLRERAIESGLPLARSLAARYRERGEPLDDLCQAAAVGLIKVVDGYDPARSVPFMVYAVPTITGALKHHFRDTTWRIRVPRNGEREERTLLDILGSIDAHFEIVTDEHVWQQLLDRLPTRERRILVMRFGQQLTQSEIAAQIGVSQMQISRLPLRSLTRLRTGMRPTGGLRASTAGAGPRPAPERNSR